MVIEWSIVGSRKIVEDPVEHTKQLWVEVAPSDTNVMVLHKIWWVVFTIQFWKDEESYNCYIIEKNETTEKGSWVPKITWWTLQSYWVHLEVQKAPQFTEQKCKLTI